MKFLKKSIYALSLVSMMGLWSCSQEEMLPGGDVTAKGHPVPVTLTVSRSDAQTRTELSENYATGGLNDFWEQDDRLHVYNAQGTEVGTLKITEGVGTDTGVFYGEVTAEQGEQELSLWYYDEEYMASEATKSSPKMKFSTYKYSTETVPSLYLDLRSQDFASAEDFKKVDVLSKKVTLNVNGEKSTVVKDEVLKAYLTFARFSLSTIPTGTTGTLDIYDIAAYGSNAITGEEYYNTKNQWSFDLGKSCVANRHTDKTNIVVNNVEGGKDVYVAFVSSPSTENGTTPGKGYKLGFIFKASNGDVYTYEFENETVLWAGKYYNAGIGEDGKIHGEEIPLVKEGGDEEVVDHSKNPLAKWAETNLDLSKNSKFATNNYDLGQFFQFGRNCGYTNYTDANSRYALYCSELTNYPKDVWGFNVFNGNKNASYIETTYSYGSETDSNPVSYFLISNSNIGGSDTDWWPERANKNDSWATRATAEGWSTGDPSPEGWRIATSQDYAEIMPNNLSNSSNTNVFGKGEIRTNMDCKYALKWDISYKTVNSSKRYILAVRALVLPKDYPVDKWSEVDWSDSNVITRFFPSAGYIQGLYINKYVSYTYNANAIINPYTFYVSDSDTRYTGKGLGWYRISRPVPVGGTDFDAYLYDPTTAYLYISKITDYSNMRTSYWTADGKCFGFSYDLNRAYSDPYYISMTKTYPKFYGMPVRCVKAD